VIAETLAGRPEVTRQFWTVLADGGEEPARRLRAACALARYDPDNGRWADVREDLVRKRGRLADLLVDRLVRADNVKYPALLLLCDIYGDEAVPLLRRELDRKPPSKIAMTERLKRFQRQAQGAVALLQLDRAGLVWPLLHHTQDPTLRTYLIHRFASLGVAPQRLVERLNQMPYHRGRRVVVGHLTPDEQEAIDAAMEESWPSKPPKVSERRALLLALGEFSPDQVNKAERQTLLRQWLHVYRNDPDPGIHSSAEWLLGRWKWGKKQLRAIERALQSKSALGGRRWYVSRHGHTLAIIDKPPDFLMGSPADEPGRSDDETQHLRRIPRSFAVATREVTVAQFKRFRPSLEHRKQYSPDDYGPINDVSWYDAAAYCRWLSEQEKVPEDQMCYPSVAEIEAAEENETPLKLPLNYLSRTGYRLPTEAEWEYACRAGASTAWAHGSSREMLAYYAWHDVNAGDRMRPVGLLKPNDLGLFDMHGNAWEWCQDEYKGYPRNGLKRASQDIADKEAIKYDKSRVVRGGAFYNLAVNARSANRDRYEPGDQYHSFGFRVARTYR
jgi:formylglycine-generating enzyme required for sulfatase activity